MTVRAALRDRIGAIATAAAGVALFASGVVAEPRVCHPGGLASKKGGEPLPPLPVLGTLVQTHTDERVLLDQASPGSLRFDALLADRATGSTAPLDPRLLELLRAIARRFGAPGAAPPKIELVSGFRSPKLNEMLRKKGHHVASHSQHSLGHAVDFRVVLPSPAGDAGPGSPAGTETALDPRVVERAIRATGWVGGTGIYTLRDDWFVHADVGPNRTWFEGPQGEETPGVGRVTEPL